MAIAKNK